MPSLLHGSITDQPFFGMPASLLCLHRELKRALGLSAKYQNDHATRYMLDALHWLPVQQFIEYRIDSLIWLTVLNFGAKGSLKELPHKSWSRRLIVLEFRNVFGAIHKARHAIFWPILIPLPLVTLCTHSGTPQKVRHTSRTPFIFSRPSTKTRTKTLCTNSLNCSRGFYPGVL